MGNRRESEPSPLRTGLVHAGLSLAVFGGLAASLGVGVHVTGDPASAGPRERIALFSPSPLAAEEERYETASFAAVNYEIDDGYEADIADAEIELAYTNLEGDGLRIDVTGGQGGPATAPAAGIRINGRLVQPGQSYGEVRGIAGARNAPAEAPSVTISSATKKAAPASKAPADVYARPFSNPEGRPAVALVIGGLGINATQTRFAIDSLPPEVTLSFAPEASRLDFWIRTARAAGHEVLIEVPMEAYDYGRLRMHPNTLLAAADKSANLARLNAVLGRANGYFGVINYQGAKFAADKTAIDPVFGVLAERGLAFIDDGSNQTSFFGQAAASSGLRYMRAGGPIDTRQSPHDIAAELMDVEMAARQRGGAIAAGFAFPVTIEAANLWISQLDEKGLILAPVSALVPQPNAEPAPIAVRRELRTGSLTKAALNTPG